MRAPVAVSVRHLSVSFEDAPVLEDLSFEVRAGELFCVVGPNAVGKTTLLRVLAGLLPAPRDSVSVPEAPRLMFQENDLFPWLTVHQNLALAQASSAFDAAEYWRLAAHYLEEVGLAGREDAYPHELSGGARQRAAIVRCFLSGAPLLLMDEPFSHLDPTSRIQLQNLILGLWRETGRTIVFVTHDLHEAAVLGERVLVLQDARRSRIIDVARRPRDAWDAAPFAADGAAVEILEALRDTAPPQRTPRRRAPRKHGASRLMYLLSPLLLLCAWETASTHGWLDPRFFPAPGAVLATLETLAASGELGAHVKASLLRLVLGLVLGGALGMVTGGLMALRPGFRAVVEPLVGITYPLPKIAILPLLLVLFGIGETSKVVTLAIGAFFLLLLSTLQGVEEVRERYGDTIRCLRLRGWDLHVRTLLLGALSPILTGVRTAAGYCLVLLVAAEFAGTGEGVGYLIWRSWELFQIEEMYAGLLVLGTAGFLLFFGLSELSRRIPWRRDTTTGL